MNRLITRFSIFVGGESKEPAKVPSQHSTTEAVKHASSNDDWLSSQVFSTMYEISNDTKTQNISDEDIAGLLSKKEKFEGAMHQLNSGVIKGCLETG